MYSINCHTMKCWRGRRLEPWTGGDELRHNEQALDKIATMKRQCISSFSLLPSSIFWILLEITYREPRLAQWFCYCSSLPLRAQLLNTKIIYKISSLVSASLLYIRCRVDHYYRSTWIQRYIIVYEKRFETKRSAYITK